METIIKSKEAVSKKGLQTGGLPLNAAATGYVICRGEDVITGDGWVLVKMPDGCSVICSAAVKP